jgi:hypothetical protein
MQNLSKLEKIEKINQYLQYSESIVNLFYELLELQNSANCKNIAEFCNLDDSKIDTAYPYEYANEIREIYPNFDKGLNVFDYSENRIFGQMRNLKNDFFNTVLKKLND